MTIETRIKQAGASEVIASNLGLELYEENPEIIETIDELCKAGQEPFKVMTGRYEAIGSGMNSYVWRIGGIALKASTDKTGRKAWLGLNGHENLIDHFIAMHSLEEYFLRNENGFVRAPKQLLAFRLPDKSNYKLEEYIPDSCNLQTKISTWSLSYDEQLAICESVKTRFAKSLRDPRFKLILYELLHSNNLNNLLVPNKTSYMDVKSMPIVVIDQPDHLTIGNYPLHLLIKSLKILPPSLIYVS